MTFVVKKGVNLFNGSLDMENEIKVVVIIHDFAHSQIQPAPLSEFEFPARQICYVSGYPPLRWFQTLKLKSVLVLKVAKKKEQQIQNLITCEQGNVLLSAADRQTLLT